MLGQGLQTQQSVVPPTWGFFLEAGCSGLAEEADGSCCCCSGSSTGAVGRRSSHRGEQMAPAGGCRCCGQDPGLCQPGGSGPPALGV